MIDNKVEAVKDHMQAIMEILDIPETESNKNTPLRIAKMWCNEFFVNRNDYNIDELKSQMALFWNNYNSEMVIVKDIPFVSMCEHHWLPFDGKVTVGYVPDKTIIGLSKIPRIVRYFSKRPQLQERLTSEIGYFIFKTLSPLAVFVEVEAVHQCVKCRGAESDCSTKTYYKAFQNEGLVIQNEQYWNEFKERM